MPVVIKCCFVAEDGGNPADNCDLRAAGGGAETEKPLEKKGEVI